MIKSRIYRCLHESGIETTDIHLSVRRITLYLSSFMPFLNFPNFYTKNLLHSISVEILQLLHAGTAVSLRRYLKISTE